MATIEEIEKLLEDKLKEKETTLMERVNEKLKRSCEHELDDIIKKRKIGEQQNFKRIANKDQYEANEKVINCLNDVEKALMNGNGSEIMSNLQKGKKFLEERQRHILIADREKHGWNVIRHYRSDALAVDEDDEKRLARSRRQADVERKGKEQSKKKFSTQNIPMKRDNSRDYRSDRPYYRDRLFNTYSTKNFSNFNRACFICGKQDHLQYTCPDRHGK